MNRKLLLALLICFIPRLIPAQSWNWVEQAGSTGNDMTRAVNTDASGNSYVVGSFYNTIFTGSNMLTSHGGADIFLAKYSPSGTLLWAQSGGGSGDDGWTMSSATDDAGNTIIAVCGIGNVTFGSYTLNNILTDITLIKYNTLGNIVFARSYGSNSNDIPHSIEIAESGSFYVTGFFNNTAHFGPYSLTSNGLTDIYLAKFDALGNALWAIKAGGSSYDAGAGVSVDSKNHLYLTGYFNSTANFSGTQLTSHGGDDIFIAGYDTLGNMNWIKAGYGTGAYDIGNSTGIDFQGNVYVTGQFWSNVQFDNITITSNGQNDIWVAKLDANGNFIWVNSFGGNGTDEGYAISVLSNGNHFVGGLFSSTVNFGGSSFTSNGGKDAVIIKQNSAGAFTWVKPDGGIGDDVCTNLDAKFEETCYVTGIFQATVNFDNYILQTTTPSDGYVGRLNAPVSSGINETNHNTSGVYPNPVSNSGVINITDNVSELTENFSLYNGIGKLVKSGNPETSTGMFSIDISEFAKGIYFLQLNSVSGNKQTIKIVIQ